MTGSYIATTTEDDVQWLMAAGQSLGLVVAQLRHHLAQTLSPAHAALLAEPVEDAAGRATDWYGQGEGAATSLDQLPPSPRATMTNTVWALLRDIRAEGVRLGRSPDADERVLGAMLEKVSHVPDIGCVRVRNDVPLLIAWAHGRAGHSVDLAQLFGPVDVPKPRPAPRPTIDRPAQSARLVWALPLMLLAVAVMGIALYTRSQRQPAETTAVATGPATLPAPTVLSAPAETPQNLPTQAILPPPRQDTTAQTAPSPTTPTPVRPDTGTPMAPPTASAERGDPTQSTTSTTQSTSAALPPPSAPPRPPNPPSTSAETRQQAQATTPDPSAPHAGTAPNAPPKPPQLPPHESEAAPSARPFTVQSVQQHDLALLQGCWNLRGSFATADVQTGASAKVSRWRTCFAPAEPGSATLSGTQSLAWADGKSCSGPVTARFLPDDKLEIADASDCLGDRTLFRMNEQCARKDDAAMLCAWTAHDRATDTDVRGDGLALSPAR